MMSDISVTGGPINMGKTYLKNVWPHGDLDIWPTEVKQYLHQNFILWRR